MSKNLSERIEVNVRFNEADPLGIVWHGHYIRYFEDGSEAFGNKHGMDILIFTGRISSFRLCILIAYKRSLRYGDKVVVETKYMPSDAAKLKFGYRLFNADNEELVATGSSVQVFLDKETSILQLTNPSFFEEWKKKMGDLISNERGFYCFG